MGLAAVSRAVVARGVVAAGKRVARAVDKGAREEAGKVVRAAVGVVGRKAGQAVGSKAAREDPAGEASRVGSEVGIGSSAGR